MVRLNTSQKIAAARAIQRPLMAVRSLAGRGPTTRVRRRGLEWTLDLREGIDFAIWLQGRFESRTVRGCVALLRPGMTAIDVGANIGAYTLDLARAVGPGGTVIACEPTDAAFARLVANVEANSPASDCVRVRQMMLLGSIEAALPDGVMSSWPLDPDAGVHPTMRGRLMSTDNASVTTMDALAREEGLERVDLVKLDVDGHECEVIDGSGEVLERHRPVIVSEIAPHALEAAGRTIGELLDRFAAARYRLERMDGQLLAAAEVARLTDERLSTNVIARPAESLPK